MTHSPDHSPLTPSSPRSDLSAPRLPDPVAAIAYASCTPAGIEPAMDDSVLTSRAAYDRLNRAAARAETLVLYRLDMLSGCRDSLDVDQERLERSIQNLWRLTAVRKTLLGIEATLNAPTSTSTPPPDDAILQQLSENIAKALAEEAELEADDEDEDNEDGDDESVPEASTESASPQSSSSSSSSLSSLSSGSISPSLNPNTQSEIRNPQSSPALSIRAVPSCPRLSPGGATRMLGRVNADLANYPGGHTYTNKDYNFAPPLGALDAGSTLLPENSAHAENADPLDDPALSDNLKSQISNPKSLSSSIHNPQSAIRNFSRPPD